MIFFIIYNIIIIEREKKKIMEYIKEEYGTKVDFLKLTANEYKVIEPFLLAHGVRTRVTMIENSEYTIQAENTYKTWMRDAFDRKLAEDNLTGFRLECYQR